MAVNCNSLHRHSLSALCLILTLLALLTLPLGVEAQRKEKRVENFVVLIIVGSLAIGWVIFIVYLNPRLIAWVLSKYLNRLLRPHKQYIYIRSISISILAGKISFKDVRYVCPDYSITVIDGWLSLRYWAVDYSRNAQETAKNSRLVVQLNGFAYHVYNRTAAYDPIRKLIEEQLKKNQEQEGSGAEGAQGMQTFEVSEGNEGGPHIGSRSTSSHTLEGNPAASSSTSSIGSQNQHQQPSVARKDPVPAWMRILPVIRIRINKGRYVVGNHTVPSMLKATFARVSMVYAYDNVTHTPPDDYIWLITGKVKNFKLKMLPNPDYDESKYGYPKFDPLSTEKKKDYNIKANDLQFTYQQAVPGVVTEQAGLEPPLWKLDLKFTTTLDIMYGANINQHRAFLTEFFYPWDYQDRPVTKPPSIGDLRIFDAFNIEVEASEKVRIYLPFKGERLMSDTDSEGDSVVYLTASQMKMLFVMPSIITSEGYTMNMDLQLFGQEIYADTSMAYPSLLDSCSNLRLLMTMKIPQQWSGEAIYDFNVKLEKPILHVFKAHVPFFLGLSTGLAGSPPPPELDFTPVRYNIHVELSDFHGLLGANTYNIIAPIEKHSEKERLLPPDKRSWNNVFLDLQGTKLLLDFSLVYSEPKPIVSTVDYQLDVDAPALQLILPEWNTVKRCSMHSFSETAIWRFKKMEIMIGTYFHTDQFNPSLTDAVIVSMRAQDIQGNLLGYFATRLQSFFDNYFGKSQHLTTFSSDSASGNVKYFLHRPVPQPTEPGRMPTVFSIKFDLTITNIALRAPRHLYEVAPSDPLLECAKFTFSIGDDGPKMESSIRLEGFSVKVDRNGHISIPSVGTHMYMLYGPKSTNYSTHIDCHLSPVTGVLSLPHIEALMRFADVFLFQLKDLDNSLPLPQEVTNIPPEVRQVENRNPPGTPATSRNMASAAAVPSAAAAAAHHAGERISLAVPASAAQDRPSTPQHHGQNDMEKSFSRDSVFSEFLRSPLQTVANPIFGEGTTLTHALSSPSVSSTSPVPALKERRHRLRRKHERSSDSLLQRGEGEFDSTSNLAGRESFHQEATSAEEAALLLSKESGFPYDTMEITIKSLQVYVLAGNDTACQIVVPHGLEVFQDTLIRETSHSFTTCRTSDIIVQQFLIPVKDKDVAYECLFGSSEASGFNNSQAESPQDWREVGVVKLSLALQHRKRLPSWSQDAAQQQEFLKRNDALFHRIPFIWQETPPQNTFNLMPDGDVFSRKATNPGGVLGPNEFHGRRSVDSMLSSGSAEFEPPEMSSKSILQNDPWMRLPTMLEAVSEGSEHEDRMLKHLEQEPQFSSSSTSPFSSEAEEDEEESLRSSNVTSASESSQVEEEGIALGNPSHVSHAIQTSHGDEAPVNRTPKHTKAASRSASLSSTSSSSSSSPSPSAVSSDSSGVSSSSEDEGEKTLKSAAHRKRTSVGERSKLDHFSSATSSLSSESDGSADSVESFESAQSNLAPVSSQTSPPEEAPTSLRRKSSAKKQNSNADLTVLRLQDPDVTIRNTEVATEPPSAAKQRSRLTRRTSKESLSSTSSNETEIEKSLQSYDNAFESSNVPSITSSLEASLSHEELLAQQQRQQQQPLFRRLNSDSFKSAVDVPVSEGAEALNSRTPSNTRHLPSRSISEKVRVLETIRDESMSPDRLSSPKEVAGSAEKKKRTLRRSLSSESFIPPSRMYHPTQHLHRQSSLPTKSSQPVRVISALASEAGSIEQESKEARPSRAPRKSSLGEFIPAYIFHDTPTSEGQTDQELASQIFLESEGSTADSGQRGSREISEAEKARAMPSRVPIFTARVMSGAVPGILPPREDPSQGHPHARLFATKRRQQQQEQERQEGDQGNEGAAQGPSGEAEGLKHTTSDFTIETQGPVEVFLTPLFCQVLERLLNDCTRAGCHGNVPDFDSMMDSLQLKFMSDILREQVTSFLQSTRLKLYLSSLSIRMLQEARLTSMVVGMAKLRKKTKSTSSDMSDDPVIDDENPLAMDGVSLVMCRIDGVNVLLSALNKGGPKEEKGYSSRITRMSTMLENRLLQVRVKSIQSQLRTSPLFTNNSPAVPAQRQFVHFCPVNTPHEFTIVLAEGIIENLNVSLTETMREEDTKATTSVMTSFSRIEGHSTVNAVNILCGTAFAWYRSLLPVKEILDRYQERKLVDTQLLLKEIIAALPDDRSNLFDSAKHQTDPRWIQTANDLMNDKNWNAIMNFRHHTQNGQVEGETKPWSWEHLTQERERILAEDNLKDLRAEEIHLGIKHVPEWYGSGGDYEGYDALWKLVQNALDLPDKAKEIKSEISLGISLPLTRFSILDDKKLHPIFDNYLENRGVSLQLFATRAPATVDTCVAVEAKIIFRCENIQNNTTPNVLTLATAVSNSIVALEEAAEVLKDTVEITERTGKRPARIVPSQLRAKKAAVKRERAYTVNEGMTAEVASNAAGRSEDFVTPGESFLRNSTAGSSRKPKSMQRRATTQGAFESLHGSDLLHHAGESFDPRRTIYHTAIVIDEKKVQERKLIEIKSRMERQLRGSTIQAGVLVAIDQVTFETQSRTTTLSFKVNDIVLTLDGDLAPKKLKRTLRAGSTLPDTPCLSIGGRNVQNGHFLFTVETIALGVQALPEVKPRLGMGIRRGRQSAASTVPKPIITMNLKKLLAHGATGGAKMALVVSYSGLSLVMLEDTTRMHTLIKKWTQAAHAQSQTLPTLHRDEASSQKRPAPEVTHEGTPKDTKKTKPPFNVTLHLKNTKLQLTPLPSLRAQYVLEDLWANASRSLWHEDTVSGRITLNNQTLLFTTQIKGSKDQVLSIPLPFISMSVQRVNHGGAIHVAQRGGTKRGASAPPGVSTSAPSGGDVGGNGGGGPATAAAMLSPTSPLSMPSGTSTDGITSPPTVGSTTSESDVRGTASPMGSPLFQRAAKPQSPMQSRHHIVHMTSDTSETMKSDFEDASLRTIDLKSSADLNGSYGLPEVSLHVELMIHEINLPLTTATLSHLYFAQSSFTTEIMEVLQQFQRPESASSLSPAEPDEPHFLSNTQLSIQAKMLGISISASTPRGTTARLDTGVMTLKGDSHGSHERPVLSLQGSINPVFLFGKFPRGGMSSDQIEDDLSVAQFKTQVTFSLEHVLVSQAPQEGKSTSESSLPSGPQRREDGAAHRSSRVPDSSVGSGSSSAAPLQQEDSDSAGAGGKDGNRSVLVVTINQPALYVTPETVARAMVFAVDYQSAYHVYDEQRRKLNRKVQLAARRLPKAPTPPMSLDRVLVKALLKNGTARIPLTPKHRQDGYQIPSHASFLLFGVEEIEVSIEGQQGSVGKMKNVSFRFHDARELHHRYFTGLLSSPERMNVGIVPSGSLRMYGKTVAPKTHVRSQDSAASPRSTLRMAITWHMGGLEIHVDSQIGRYLSSTTRTLTYIINQLNLQSTSSVSKNALVTPVSFEKNPTLHVLQTTLKRQVLLVDHLRHIGADPLLIRHTQHQLEETKKLLLTRFDSNTGLKKEKHKKRKKVSAIGSPAPVEEEEEAESTAAEPEPEPEAHNPLDLEIDIIVSITSGLVVLHVAENRMARAAQAQTSFPKQKSYGGELGDEEMNVGDEEERRPYLEARAATLEANSVEIAIPQLYVQANYSSSALPDTADQKDMSQGNLRAMIAIASPKKNFIISPVILDFFLDVANAHHMDTELSSSQNSFDISDQVLGDILNAKLSTKDNDLGGVLVETMAPTTNKTMPLNISVKIDMDPIDFTFSCQPKSHIECVVVLPKVSMFLGSEALANNDRSTSVTARLSRLSVYLFHPFSTLSTSHKSLTRALEVSLDSMTFQGSQNKRTRPDGKKVTHTSVFTEVKNLALSYDMTQIEEIHDFRDVWLHERKLKKFFFPNTTGSKMASKSDSEESGSSESEDGATTTTETLPPSSAAEEVRNDTSGSEEFPDDDGEAGTQSSRRASDEREIFSYVFCVQESSLTVNFGKLVGQISLNVNRTNLRGITIMDERSDIQGRVEEIRILSDQSTAVVGLNATLRNLGVGGTALNADSVKQREGACLHFVKVNLDSVLATAHFHRPCILVFKQEDLKFVSFDTHSADRYYPDVHLIVNNKSLSLFMSRDAIPAIKRLVGQMEGSIREQTKNYMELYKGTWNAERELPEPVSAAPVRTPRMRNGTLVFNNQSLAAGFFKNKFTDSNLCLVRMGLFKASFTTEPDAEQLLFHFERRSRERQDRLVRNQKFVIDVEKPASISLARPRALTQLVLSTDQDTEDFLVVMGNTANTTILQLPRLRLISEQRVDKSGGVVDCALDSKFYQGLQVSLDGNLYVFLIDMYEGFMARDKRTPQPFKKDENMEFEEKVMMGEKRPAARELNFICKVKQVGGASPRRQKEHSELCQFHLEPSLSATGTIGKVDLPDISWLFERLGIRNPHKTINTTIYYSVNKPQQQVLRQMAAFMNGKND